MIVLNARGAKLEGQKLTLDGISPNAIVFADRPVRSAGHALTAHLLEEWSSNAPDSFAKTPPNATVSVFNKAKAGVVDAVVVLKSPKLEGDRLDLRRRRARRRPRRRRRCRLGLHGHHQPADRATDVTSWRVVRRRALASVAMLRANAQKNRHAPTKTVTKRSFSEARRALWHAPSCANRAQFNHNRGKYCACIICKE